MPPRRPAPGTAATAPTPPSPEPATPEPEAIPEAAPVEVLPPEPATPETTATTAPASNLPATRKRRTKAEMDAARAAAGQGSGAPVAPGQTSEVVPYQPPQGRPALGEIQGEIETTDLQLPQLKIANAVGPLSQLNPPVPPGTIVLGSGDQWLYLYSKWTEAELDANNRPVLVGGRPKMVEYESPAVGVTILRAKKQFGQITDEAGNNLYDQDLQGLTFDTKEEMQNAGGTLGTSVPGMLGFEAQLTCQVLVRMPEGFEDDLGIFNIELAEGRFAMAMWYIRGSSYGECAKKIFTEKTQFLAAGSHTAEFEMTGKRIIGKRNSWFVPTLKNGYGNSEELIAYLVENGA